MASHNHTGKNGEILAAAWFQEKGYNIIHQNWRHRNWEIDIIASRNGMLHIIEVKTRTTLLFGYPEDNVSTKKINYLIAAAEEYLILNPQWIRIQFDILSIIIKNKEVEYFLIEDVYV